MSGSTPQRFRFDVFIVASIIFLLLTIVSFLAAFQRDEGTYLEESVFFNLVADSFSLFRFPTHTLFWAIMSDTMFIPGLLLNVVMWAFATERLWTLGSRLIKRR